MTYSIVARDPETHALGVAVQTCAFAVGGIVPWAIPGVGAVATQAFAEKAYGPRCLDALAGGASATTALAEATGSDPTPACRQVGVVGADGMAAARTGEQCIDHAGHVVGDGFTVQANMMASPTVWPAMADAYTSADGALARRLLAALDAAQAEGGDARGVMSAALLVVEGEPRDAWSGRLVDLRVDRSADPLGDLRRLLDAAGALAGYRRVSNALSAANAATALTEVDQALSALPGEESLRFLRARALLAAGRTDAGRDELRALVAARPSWATIARSFAEKGVMPLPADVSFDALVGPA